MVAAGGIENIMKWRMPMKIKNNLQNHLKGFNYQLFFTLILISLLPAVYNTVRIFFLGNLPGDWGFNIASQLAWVNVIYEVIQEALILPLFYLICKSLDDRTEMENKVRTVLVTSFAIYLAASVIMIIAVKPLLIFMSQKDELVGPTATYIRIETIAILLSVLYKFISIVLISLKNIKSLLVILAIQMILTIISDTFLISELPFSFQLGVNGIAIGNIVINVILFIVGAILLLSEDIKVFTRNKLSFAWQKEWWKIGSISGLELFIRNFAFIVMILKMINMVQEQGNYWVANNFIWGWLLLPVLALGELIKQNVAETHKNAVDKFKQFMIITGIIILVWILSIPGWKPFIQHIMNAADYETVYQVVIISFGFYIIFALNNVVDSIFYGLGRTDLMLYQSLIVNTLFYGTMFVLYKLSIFQPTLIGIALMFGTGMALDSVITFIMYGVLVKKKRLIKAA
jgi:Na+-driven multidrug efflux pump